MDDFARFSTNRKKEKEGEREKGRKKETKERFRLEDRKKDSGEERTGEREWLPTRPQTPHVASRRLKPVLTRLTLVWEYVYETRGENTREILLVREGNENKETCVR